MITQTVEKTILNELSDRIIPAVPGEFYSYSSRFTEDRSLYALMKCKASKNRMLASAAELGSEANLVFLFDDDRQVCSVRQAHAYGLLDDSVNAEMFGETWISAVGIAIEDFYKIRSQMDIEALVEICRAACSKHERSVRLQSGMVVAMQTDADKYGMFLIKQIDSFSIEIDACHILL